MRILSIFTKFLPFALVYTHFNPRFLCRQGVLFHKNNPRRDLQTGPDTKRPRTDDDRFHDRCIILNQVSLYYPVFVLDHGASYDFYLLLAHSVTPFVSHILRILDLLSS